MNKLIALVHFLLSLAGLDAGGATLVHRSSAHGTDVVHARTHVQAGVAHFECLGSASGECHFTVLPRRCAPGAGAAPSDACRAAVRRIRVPSGDSRHLAGLHDFGLCVSADGEPQGPDCRPVTALAAR